MDDKKIKSLLDRKSQKAKQPGSGPESHFQLCLPGSRPTVTFKPKDGERHLSIAYHYLQWCYFWQDKGYDHIRAVFNSWEVHLVGRGLAVVHQAIDERKLAWVRAASPGEVDVSSMTTFVGVITVSGIKIGPNIASEKTPAK